MGYPLTDKSRSKFVFEHQVRVWDMKATSLLWSLSLQSEIYCRCDAGHAYGIDEKPLENDWMGICGSQYDPR